MSDDHLDAVEPGPPAPSVFIYDPGDDEHTRLTRIAHRVARHAIDTQELDALPVQFVTLESGETIVLELHGQSSVTGHGKQGLRPERIGFLRTLEAAGFAVLLVFVEGVESLRYSWLHDLGAAQPIAKGDPADRTTARFGWHVGEMGRHNAGVFHLPSEVTHRERAQGAIL